MEQAISIQSFSLYGCKVILAKLGVWLHGFVPGLPSSRANFIWVLLHVLQGLERSLSLIDAAANGKVVNGGVLNNTFLVNNEKSSQRNPLIGNQHAVRF